MCPDVDKWCFYPPKLSSSGDPQHQMWDAVTESKLDYKNEQDLWLSWASRTHHTLNAQKVLLCTPCDIPSSGRERGNHSASVKREPALGTGICGCSGDTLEHQGTAFSPCFTTVSGYWCEESLRASQGYWVTCWWGTPHPAYRGTAKQQNCSHQALTLLQESFQRFSGSMMPLFLSVLRKPWDMMGVICW